MDEKDDRAPRMGITTCGRNDEGHFTLPAKYIDAVRRAGGSPILLAPGEQAIWGRSRGIGSPR